MPFYKSLVFSIILSLAAGAILFFMAPGTTRGSSVNYGLLIVDADFPDRQVLDLLVRGGFEPPLSESSQWVFLDDFEGLELVTLDDYAGRLEPYDPRDDGYAAKLQSFFAAGGKRRFFIPLGAAQNIAEFRSRIGTALGDIPFSAFILKSPQSPLPLALFFAVAAALTLILAGDAPGSFFLLPIWLLLCREGSTGFALSAVLALLFRTLREPVLELFISRHYKTSRTFLRDFAGSWAFAPILIVFYMLIGISGVLDLPVLILGIAAFAALGVITLRIELALSLKRGHVRFLPIRISGAGRPSAPLPWFVLPFALASLGILVLFAFGGHAGLGNPGNGDVQTALADWEGVPLVMAADYEEHIRFQHAFSYLPLEIEEESTRLYQSYELDATGLIAGPVSFSLEENAAGGIVVRDIVASTPPFPLTELMEFLESYSFPGASDPPPETLLPALIVLCLSVPLFLGGLYRRRKNGKFSIYIDKRVVA
jgi:hypothetical protein